MSHELNQDHILRIDFDLYKHGIIADIVKRAESLEFNEFLRAERRITIASRSVQEWRVLFARIRFDRVGYVASIIDPFALIEQRECDLVAERPRKQGVEFALANA